jgi:hypothetical protein
VNADADWTGLRRRLSRGLASHRRWRFLYRSVAAVAKSGLAVIAGGLLSASAESLLGLPLLARQSLWLLSAGAALVLFLKTLGSDWSIESAARAAGRHVRPGDLFLNAWELAVRGGGPAVSDELARRHARTAADALARLSPRTSMRPRGWSRWFWTAAVESAFAAVLLLAVPAETRAVWARACFPFGATALAGVAAVEPGDARRPRGEDVPVSVRLLPGVSGEPEFWVRTGVWRWEERGMRPAGPDVFVHRLSELSEAVTYKIRHRGQWSRPFVVEPYTPPGFASLRAEVRPPAYTRRPSAVHENVYELRVPAGSRIAFEGRLDAPVRDVTVVSPDGRVWPARREGPLDVRVDVEADEPLELVFRLDDGASPAASSSPRVRVVTVPDEAPSVLVLSPAQDLLVAPDEPLPILLELSDDHGFGETRLVYRVNGGPETDAPWAGPADAVEAPGGGVRAVVEKTWFLSALRLKAGDSVRYHFTAADNDPRGRGRGRSAGFTLRAASYRDEHESIRAALSDLRRDLVALLSEQSLLREDLKSEPPAWDALARRQAEAGRGLSETRQAMERVVARLERDPLSDLATLGEYRGMRENLAQVESDSLPRARAGLASRDRDAAGRAMDRIVAELERLSLLSEDVWKAEGMRDLLQSQGDLSRAADSLLSDLEARAGGKLSPEDARRLDGVMAEMADLMRDIAERLKDMPRELPEEFVNQAALKDLRLDEAADLLSRMGAAVARGDAEAALAAARELADRLREMKKALDDAAGGLPGGPSWFGDELGRELDGRVRELDELVGRQEKLKTETGRHADAALRALLERQTGSLAGLADETARLGEALGRLRQGWAGFADPVRQAEGAVAFARLEPLLARWRAELSQGRLQNAPAFAVESAGLADGLAAALETPGADSDARVREERRRELAALRASLKRIGETVLPPASDRDFLSGAEAAEVAAARTAQESLRKDTAAYRRRLQELSRKTALLAPRLFDGLAAAAEAMARAGDELDAVRLRPAVERQEEALRHLREGQESMRAAGGGARGLGRSVGKPAAGSVQFLPGGGSSTGAGTGPVRLPRAEDYRPPREFREELLKSMKERYPESYERIIQDYYRHWTR